MTGRCQIITADVMAWAAEYDGPPFHAAFCDPPYHLASIQRRFGSKNAAPAQHGKDGAFKRMSAGFMGAQWDGVDENGMGVAFRPETWAALGAHLHPGAFMMAFAGTRSYHRMACAIEDAGFLIHPVIVWAFGSGFPKATRVKDERFNGHRYGLQSMKPALECICVAQKPYEGKPVDSITGTGAGALWIDGGRIDTNGRARTGSGSRAGLMGWGTGNNGNRYTEGRWPANLCFDREAAMVLDRQSGIGTSREGLRGLQTSGQHGGTAGEELNLRDGTNTVRGHTDSGGASRFYHVSDWEAEEHDPFFYCAKAGRDERDAGLEGGIVLPNAGKRTLSGGEDTRGRPATELRNVHPCVKPLRLTRWLATLLLPPAEYAPRRILVPFAGSGSEAIGAMLAGWDDVTGLEMSEEYADIARARVKFWSGNVGLFDSLTAESEEEEAHPVLDLT